MTSRAAGSFRSRRVSPIVQYYIGGMETDRVLAEVELCTRRRVSHGERESKDSETMQLARGLGLLPDEMVVRPPNGVVNIREGLWFIWVVSFLGRAKGVAGAGEGEMTAV